MHVMLTSKMNAPKSRGSRILPLLLCAILSSSCDASFAPPTRVGVNCRRRRSGDPRRPVIGKAFDATTTYYDGACEADANDCYVGTITTSYETHLESSDRGSKRGRRGLLPWMSSRRRRGLSRRRGDGDDDDVPRGTTRYRFAYDYNALAIGNESSTTTTGMILIHPIGVGIGKWYYDRLLRSLRDNRDGDVGRRVVVLVPDLLGSATASGPTCETTNNGDDAISSYGLPLLNVTDWTRQISHLMAECEATGEADGRPIVNWTIVANGGCAPIALRVAATSISRTSPFVAPLTNVIISSPPSLSFFLETSDPIEVRKSYRTLSGVVGKLFWWYALRKDGRFIRKFSERNLVGNPENLGELWTPNCLRAACLHGGRSRYSTFAFLAGALRDGCVDSLDTLRGRDDVRIDFIRGDDTRRNQARSWFWTRKGGGRAYAGGEGDTNDDEGVVDSIRDLAASANGSIRKYVQNNGNVGRELCVGGRISLAWEDPNGYAKSLMVLVSE